MTDCWLFRESPVSMYINRTSRSQRHKEEDEARTGPGADGAETGDAQRSDRNLHFFSVAGS